MKPFKIKYYCEKRDPDFETKMHEVLLVYKQIEMQFDENGDLIVPDDYKLTITVSLMRNRGFRQSPILHRIYARSRTRRGIRDAEYKRLGTLSCWQALICYRRSFPLVSEAHKSSDFIEFLRYWIKNIHHRINPDHSGYHSAHLPRNTALSGYDVKGRFNLCFSAWLMVKHD